MGLGRVKTLWRKYSGVATAAGAMRGHFFGFDYARIAVMSG
jgi:hypothetical protein